MIDIYKSYEGTLTRCDDIATNTWINLTNPTAEEINFVASACQVEAEDLSAVLDDEESSRLELSGTNSLLIIDVPMFETRLGHETFNTIPLAIIMTPEHLITAALKTTMTISRFIENRPHNVNLAKRLRCIYQILFIAANVYQQHLREIEAERLKMEESLGKTSKTKNADLMKLHELESNLVYFETSLRGNKALLDRITRSSKIEQYPQDADLLEDATIEMDQAIEMASIYRSIIGSTRDLFASVLDNGINDVMKILTSVTILLAIPTVIAGLYGMNVASTGMPLGTHPYAFGLICLVTLLLCGILALWLHKKKLL